MSPTILGGGPTAVLRWQGLQSLIVCTVCHRGQWAWRPATLEAFRAWHSERCVKVETGSDLVKSGSKRPRGEGTPGARPTPTREARA